MKMRHALRLMLLFSMFTAANAADYSPGWQAFYYADPQPGKFVEQVQGMAKDGKLGKGGEPGLVGFFSRVMAQNPKEIDAWMKALDGLTPPQKRVLYSALWYSDTPEAKAFFQHSNLGSYLKKNPPDILAMEPDSPATLDMLWGYFMATGDAGAVRRIVSALNFAPNAGALDRFVNTKKTEEDKKSAFMDSTFQAAKWSILTNAALHPKVMEICESLLKGNTLTPDERKNLEEIVNRIKSESNQATKTNE